MSEQSMDTHESSLDAIPTVQTNQSVQNAQKIVTDTEFANPWGVDLSVPTNALKIVAERLSIVRYVFLVQIEDGIASAAQRASLEYADAVLIGWPESDDEDVVDITDEQHREVRAQIQLMEEYIDKFSAMERDADIDGMTDTLIRITERVAHVRRTFQPQFLLPTFAEIRRVVQDEWNEDMGKIDTESADDENPKALKSLQSEFENIMSEAGDSMQQDAQ